MKELLQTFNFHNILKLFIINITLYHYISLFEIRHKFLFLKTPINLFLEAQVNLVI